MRYLAIFLLFFSLLSNVSAQTKNILMIVAPVDFRDEEVFIPKKIFEENGYKVEIASKQTEANKAKGMAGAEITVDLLLDQVRFGKYDAIVIAGGPGSNIYWNDETVISIIKDARKNKEIIGAICIAPVCLANAGILKGKRATVFANEAQRLKEKGAEYSAVSVVVDDGIVTADGPFESEEFAYKILEELQK
jgi:protease I